MILIDAEVMSGCRSCLQMQIKWHLLQDGDGEITSAKQMEYKAKVRASLRRADSTISRHRRGGGEKGSTVNEEMLKGLGSKDAPRVEVLSEALQGPPIEPVRDQLAALSQVRT